MEFRKILCNELSALMKENDKIVVLDADLGKPNGISPLSNEFPDRYFQVGIAEANMAGICAGLSAYGYKPVMVTFTPFATRRVYDQIAVSIAYAKQKVVIIGTDPGITAELNGGTHMSFEDVAIMRAIPDMVIYDAVDTIQLSQALRELINLDKNIYIRMPRKFQTEIFGKDYKYIYGKADILKEGKDVTIIATGTMVNEVVKTKEMLNSVKKTNCVVTCENNNIKGGLYSAVSELLCTNYPAIVIPVGVDDKFGQVGKYNDLLNAYHLTPADILKKVKLAINKK